MSGPQIELTGGAVLVGAGLLVAGFIAWRAAQNAAALANTISTTAGELWTDVGEVAQDGYNGATNAIEKFTWTNPLGVAYQTSLWAIKAAPTAAQEIAEWWDEPPPAPTFSTGQGRWNNPSAYTVESGGVTPGYSGSGGAAFGIYPRP